MFQFFAFKRMDKMMDNYPGNSRASRETPKKSAPEPTTDRKIERVVSGEVTRRKRPMHKRFADTFIGGDNQSVGQYIVMDVLVPGVKDILADAVTSYVQKMIFGEQHSTARSRGRTTSSGFTSTVNYRGVSTGSRAGYREDPRAPRRHVRDKHSFDDILLATRVEAEEVLDRMFDCLSRYDEVKVADLYEMIGITGDHTDQKWGWIDLRGSEIVRSRDGYLLDLPKPVPLT